MSGHYYNEWEPFRAQWLRNLIARGLLPAGEVDERDIRQVEPGDLRGFVQCHFFAGIGGWPYALRLAGWPEDRPVWTGSCPCQPFSSAGRRRGFADDRHLWPAWFRLIRECRPEHIFGEQVAGKFGLLWLDAVAADLEGCGYAIGAVDLPAAGVGAPHKRERRYFCADAQDYHRRTGTEGITDSAGRGRGRPGGDCEPDPWSDYDWLPAEFNGETFYIPAEPGVCPLADGVPTRVGRISAYGDAIVPQVGAIFIRATMEQDDEALHEMR